jgi:nucleotide-binding universal stress UspA family protein
MSSEPSFCAAPFTPAPLATVLAGSALDAGSDAVLRAALAVARAAGARLHVLHAIELPPVPAFPDAPWITPELVAADAAERRRELLAQLDRLALGGDAARPVVVQQTAHRALLESARELGAGLIVVGATRAEGRLERLLGTTADRLLRKASCPVLVVRGELPVPPGRVVAPVDLTSLSADALRCGLHLLAQIGAGEGMRVTAFHVLSFLGSLALRHRTEPMASEEEAERAARAALASLVAACGEAVPHPIAIEPKLLSGDPRIEILREIAEASPDLVLMGTHAYRPLDRLLLGSVTATVAREARCGLLVVPPEAALGEAIAEAVAADTAP